MATVTVQRWFLGAFVPLTASLALGCSSEALDEGDAEYLKNRAVKPSIAAVDYPRTFPAGTAQVITVTWAGDLRLPTRFSLGQLGTGLCPFDGCGPQYIQEVTGASVQGNTAKISVLYCPPDAIGQHEYGLRIVDREDGTRSDPFPMSFTCTRPSDGAIAAASPTATRSGTATSVSPSSTPRTGATATPATTSPTPTRSPSPTATPTVVRNFTITMSSTAGTNRTPGKTTVGWNGNPLFPVSLRGTIVSCPVDCGFSIPRIEQGSSPVTLDAPFCAVNQRRVFVFDVEMVDATGARSPKVRLTQTCDP